MSKDVSDGIFHMSLTFVFALKSSQRVSSLRFNFKLFGKLRRVSPANTNVFICFGYVVVGEPFIFK